MGKRLPLRRKESDDATEQIPRGYERHSDGKHQSNRNLTKGQEGYDGHGVHKRERNSAGKCDCEMRKRKGEP